MNNAHDTAFKALDMLAPLLEQKCLLLHDRHRDALLAKMGAAAKSPRAQASRPQAPRARASRPSFQSVGGSPTLACIPVIGVLTKYPSVWDWQCGLCPCVNLIEQLAESVQDPDIGGIVLDVDSPGGFVNGTVEFADAVAAANQVKPVITVIRGTCCSGAYWFASQSRRIITRPESEVGNIGVYSVLVDISALYASMGIELSVVASGEFKGLGADGKVTDAMREETARINAGLFGQFKSAVIEGRELSGKIADGLFDGRAYLGADAVGLGLVDDVATSFDGAIALAVQTIGAASTSAANARKAAKNPPTPEAIATAEWKADDLLRVTWKDCTRYVQWRSGQLKLSAQWSDGAAARPMGGAVAPAAAEATAKQEWRANLGDCRNRFLNEATYISVRKRELAA